MSSHKTLWLATASALVLLPAAPALAQQTQDNVTIVQPGEAAEDAGQAAEDAAEATGEAAQDAAQATGEAAQDAAQATGEAVQDAAQATGEATGDAAEATGQAVEGAADATADAATSAGEAMQDATTTDAEVTVVEPTEVETEEVAEGTPVAGQIFEQSPDTYLASTMMDAVIMNAADEEIGDVNDMVLGADGQVEGVVIGVGGFLGVGEKNVAIELSRLEISEEENGELTFMLDATAEELEAAPAFVTAEEERREAEASAARNMPGTMSTPTTTPPATVAPPATTAN